jgi:hypothetical protein
MTSFGALVALLAIDVASMPSADAVMALFFRKSRLEVVMTQSCRLTLAISGGAQSARRLPALQVA